MRKRLIGFAEFNVIKLTSGGASLCTYALIASPETGLDWRVSGAAVSVV
jgi:hypothetical protein